MMAAITVLKNQTSLPKMVSFQAGRRMGRENDRQTRCRKRSGLLRRNIQKTLRNFAVAVNVAFDPGHEA